MNGFDEFVEFFRTSSVRRPKQSCNLRHVFVNVKSIDRGLKPGYLWDKSPFLPANDIQRLVDDMMAKGVVKNRLDVFSLNGDVFIVNKNVLIGLLAEPLEYFAFFNASSLALMSKRDLVSVGIDKCVREFCEDLRGWEEPQVREVPAKSHWSIPCLYGLILGYPVVLWLSPDAYQHSLDAKPLVNCKVRVIYGSCNGEELFSFSYLPLEQLTAHVDLWFNTLELKCRDLVSVNMERQIVSSSAIAL